jgi:phytoene dehydrogenase-like protein
VSLPAPFAHETLDRSTHYFWEDGKSLVAWSDRAKFVRSAIEAFGPDAAKLESHIKHSGQSFEATRQIFLEQSLHDGEAQTNQPGALCCRLCTDCLGSGHCIVGIVSG